MNQFTLGIHYPKEGLADKIVDAAAKISETARGCEGNVDAGVLRDEKSDRIIMFSLWENISSAIQASKKLRPLIAEIPFSDWERQPSDNMVELERLG